MTKEINTTPFLINLHKGNTLCIKNLTKSGLIKSPFDSGKYYDSAEIELEYPLASTEYEVKRFIVTLADDEGNEYEPINVLEDCILLILPDESLLISTGFNTEEANKILALSQENGIIEDMSSIKRKIAISKSALKDEDTFKEFIKFVFSKILIPSECFIIKNN